MSYRIVVVYLLLFISFLTLGQSSKSLDNQWYVLDNGVKQELKSIDKISQQVIHLDVNPIDQSAGKIVLSSAASNGLFINGEIQCVFKNDASHEIEIDQRTRLISIYNSEGVGWIDSKLVFVNLKADSAGLITEQRENSSFSNFLIFSILVVLSLYAFFMTRNTELFNNHFRFSRGLTIRTINEALFKIRISETENLMLLGIHGLAGAIVIVAFAHHLHHENFFQIVSLESNFWTLNVYWVLTGVAVFMGLLFKTLLVSAFTELFSIKSFRRIHFYTYLRISILVYMLWLLLILIQNYVFPQIDLIHIILNFGLLLMIFRIVLIQIKLMNLETHRFLFLFSYLCATEIIPFIFLVKTVY